MFIKILTNLIKDASYPAAGAIANLVFKQPRIKHSIDKTISTLGSKYHLKISEDDVKGSFSTTVSIFIAQCVFLYEFLKDRKKDEQHAITLDYFKKIHTLLQVQNIENNIPIDDATLEAIVSRFYASQLISQGEEIQRINFDIGLGKMFTSPAIEALEADTAKFIVDKAAHDKQIALIRAQGEADCSMLIGKAANNPAFLNLRRIEAARDIAHSIASSSNTVILNSKDLLLNLHDTQIHGVDDTQK